MISGPGGVGKSSLLVKLQEAAQTYGASTVWADENESNILQVLESVSAQLSRQDIPLKKFDKKYELYLRKKSQLISLPDAPQGIASFLAKNITRTGLAFARGTPIGGILEVLGGDELANQIGEWLAYTQKKVKATEELHLLLNPVYELTIVFLQDMARIRKQTLAIFIDTYERTGNFLDVWLHNLLSGFYGYVPTKILFVIAGRKCLDPNQWVDFTESVDSYQLKPFSEEETREYLWNYHIKDEQMVQEIRRITGDLPLMVALLASGVPSARSNIHSNTSTAVDRFLKWISDPNKRRLCIDAALPRSLNMDILSVLLSEDDVSDLFTWLRGQPFVHQETNGWRYHEVVRAHMLRHKRLVSKQEWESLHSELAVFYGERLSRITSEAILKEAVVQFYRLEHWYHRLCSSMGNRFVPALTALLGLLEKVETGPASRLAQTFVQAGKDCDNKILMSYGKIIYAGLMGNTIKDHEEFVALLTSILTSNGLDNRCKAVVYAWRGLSYRWLEDYNRALLDLDKAIELYPSYYWAIAQRGAVYALQGSYKKSLDDLQIAVSLKPNNSIVITLRGATYRLLGKYEEALRDFDQIITRDPEDVWAMTHRGILYREVEDYEAAFEDFNCALATDSQYVWALAHRGITYRQIGDYGKALRDLNKAVSIMPEYKRALANLAETYRVMRKYRKALTKFTKALDIDPEFAWAYVSRGETYRSMRSYRKAIADYDRALQIEPDNQFAFASRGECKLRLRRHRDAIRDFSLAIELEPEYRWALVGRGKAYRQIRLLDKALADLNKAVELAPSNPWAWANRGETLRLLNQLPDAISDFTKAITLKPRFRWALGRRGQAFQGMGELEKALADFKAILEFEHNNDWARHQIVQIRGELSKERRC